MLFSEAADLAEDFFGFRRRQSAKGRTGLGAIQVPFPTIIAKRLNDVLADVFRDTPLHDHVLATIEDFEVVALAKHLVAQPDSVDFDLDAFVSHFSLKEGQGGGGAVDENGFDDQVEVGGIRLAVGIPKTDGSGRGGPTTPKAMISNSWRASKDRKSGS